MRSLRKSKMKGVSKDIEKIFDNLMERIDSLENTMARHKIDNERTRTILQQGYDPYPHLRLVKK